MNKLLLSLTLSLLLTAASAFAGDSRYYTRVIHPTDPELSVALPANLVMKITNFVQAGSTNTSGVVTVYQGLASQAGINVLVADSTISTIHQNHEDTYIAGLAYVRVAPVPGATLFITYQLSWN
jgi:hypothetical protein